VNTAADEPSSHEPNPNPKPNPNPNPEEVVAVVEKDGTETSAAKEWFCMSCNHHTPTSEHVCSNTQCKKARAHFGCDVYQAPDLASRRSNRARK
jgi:hypothetical protein